MKLINNKKGVSFIILVYFGVFLLAMLFIAGIILLTVNFNPAWIFKVQSSVNQSLNNTVVYTGG